MTINNNTNIFLAAFEFIIALCFVYLLISCVTVKNVTTMYFCYFNFFQEVNWVSTKYV